MALELVQNIGKELGLPDALIKLMSLHPRFFSDLMLDINYLVAAAYTP